MTEEKKKKSILILPEHISEAPLTTLDEEQSQEFRRLVVRRCTENQLNNGLREATDSYTFGRGDDIDHSLMECYEVELKERKDRLVFRGGKFTLERKEAKRFSLFIKRHAQYIFSSPDDGSENLDFA